MQEYRVFQNYFKEDRGKHFEDLLDRVLVVSSAPTSDCLVPPVTVRRPRTETIH